MSSVGSREWDLLSAGIFLSQGNTPACAACDFSTTRARAVSNNEIGGSASWWPPSECLNQAHRLLAFRAADHHRSFRHGGRSARWQGIEHGLDPLELVLRCRALPSVGSHPTEPLGQDVLKEPRDE